jgi:hypothetical protein
MMYIVPRMSDMAKKKTKKKKDEGPTEPVRNPNEPVLT